MDEQQTALLKESERLRGLLVEGQKVNDKLSKLLEIAQDLTSELNLDRLLNLIMERTTEVMEAERSSLYLIDWERREIYTKIAQQVGTIRQSIDAGISGWVARTGETLNVEDAWTYPHFNPEWDIKHHFRTRSVLCMPLIGRGGERIGVIQVINRFEGRFTEEDQELLSGLCSLAGIAIENASLLEEQKLSFESFIQTLGAAIDAKDPLTAGHSQRVTEYSLLIGSAMGMREEELEVLRYACLLHDFGKIGISDAVLTKDGLYNSEEREAMHSHARKTRDLLENIRFARALKEVPYIASQHHERLDGRGYPYRLTDEHIALPAKIIGVADVFDALTSRRHYPKYAGGQVFGHDPMPLKRVVALIDQEAGVRLDAEVVEVFKRCLKDILIAHRGEHFPEAYVDEYLRDST